MRSPLWTHQGAQLSGRRAAVFKTSGSAGEKSLRRFFCFTIRLHFFDSPAPLYSRTPRWPESLKSF